MLLILASHNRMKLTKGNNFKYSLIACKDFMGHFVKGYRCRDNGKSLFQPYSKLCSHNQIDKLMTKKFYICEKNESYGFTLYHKLLTNFFFMYTRIIRCWKPFQQTAGQTIIAKQKTAAEENRTTSVQLSQGNGTCLGLLPTALCTKETILAMTPAVETGN